jgi:hypothetical protein
MYLRSAVCRRWGAGEGRTPEAPRRGSIRCFNVWWLPVGGLERLLRERGRRRDA